MMFFPLLSLYMVGFFLLNITGTTAIALNSARNKTVTMSSVNWPGTFAVDGNLSTDRGVCQCCAGTDKQDDPWLRVDLGSKYSVLNVVIYGRTDLKNNTVQNYNGMKIFLHEDEKNVTEAVDTIPDTGAIWYYKATLVTPVTARYVTIQLGVDKRLVVCEIQVFTQGINVALRKTVTISSQFPEANFNASHAVDGKLLGSLDSGTCNCCAATGTKWNPWIRVDLGGVFRIFTLVIYGRTGLGENFNNMNIYLHRIMNKGSPVRTFKTAGVFINEKFDPDILARYVTLQQMAHLLTVYCEVEVYGECPSGTFAPKCKTCHCDGPPCDIWAGVCPSGKCLPGYFGESCDQDCTNRTYGQNCSKQCGQCLAMEPCDNINGSCTLCAPGYTGTHCTSECSNRTFGLNCSKDCGHCFGDEQCNVTSGYCDGLCSPGYNGTHCNISCSSRTYGHNCNESCGHCLNDEVCDGVNGTCDLCKAGYEGQLCKTQCAAGTFGLNCTVECGNCRSGEPCDVTSGKCKNGCSAGYNGAGCKSNCSDGTFGFDCRGTCHCKDNVSCDHVSGRCPGGDCENGWVGGGNCSFRTNIALNKTVEMSPAWPNEFPGSNAVDGRLPGDETPDTCGCCAVTTQQTDPWLRVDLGAEFRMSTVIVYGQNNTEETSSQMNISIEVEKDEAEISRIYESPAVITNLTFDPPVIGRYILVQQTGNVKAVYCEIEVFGECPTRTFGPDCRSCNCNGSACDVWDGVCPSGKCLPGYTGISCDRECDDMTYGQNCSEKCGKCYNEQRCDFVNGTCQLCEPGYMGDLCKTVCSAGKYGQNCSGDCGYCNGECDRATGKCSNGCQNGYIGERCEQQCENNTYGQNCSFECGNCLSTCNHVNGTCGMCTPGYIYTDAICKTECDGGKYGSNCSKKCGHCFGDKQCNISSGRCEEGCLPGYKEGLCTEKCNNGTYGINCTASCGHCFGGRDCDTANGSCGGQCAAGYTGDKCDQECGIYWYGHNCSEQCGYCRENVTCDNVDGTCKLCEPGYENDMFCKTNCSSGYFGLNCSEECGKCNGMCNFKSGLCSGGCLDGYRPANRCNEKCSGGTYGHNCNNICHCLNNVTCDYKTGHCPNNSCGFGWSGEICNISTNVALNKPVNISSQFPGTNFIASHAVNGKLLESQASGTCYCCAATGKQWNPWIRVDLGGVFRIFTLMVYGRNEFGDTFNNMNIYLHLLEGYKGNATKTFRFSDVFINVTFDPDILARYVTLQQMGNLLTVYCEVEVYGECPSGTFGPDCRTCHCDGSACDIWLGVCPSGKCLPGYIGVSCDQTCSTGTYGQNCSEQCGRCLNMELCNIVDGACDECAPGYDGKLCKSECRNGTFGINCSNECGHCSTCDFISGKCLDSCSPGYNGTYCNQTCPSSTYGEKCSLTCGLCLNGEPCDTVSGACQLCIPGYRGETCSEVCQPGTYGISCKNICGNCLTNSTCNAISGICEEGCASGYIGDMCNETCRNGYFGQKCAEQCTTCFEGEPCDKVSGKCLRCPPGLQGDFCKQECNDGTYGSNCRKICGQCINNDVCHNRTGECLNGCSDGYTGSLCVQKVISQPTDGGSGAVVGVVVTLLILFAIAGLVGFVLIRRRRMSKPLLHPRLGNGIEYIRKKVFPQRRDSTGGLVNGFDMPVVDSNEHVEKSKPKTIRPKLENYCNIQTSIELTDLWDFINLHKANERDYFQKEFKKLKEGLIHKCNAALLLENAGKTRYKGLCAYDHSRVILVCENKDEVDYINANFINGYNSKAKFIASQGPTKAMINDFWRMIWQQEVEIVVMLTNLIELGVKKCVQYWPEDLEANFGNIHVTVIKTDSFKDYDIRLLEIRKDGAIYDTTKVVTQYHFRSWPDKDVPRTTWCLVNFWRIVDLAVRNSKRERPVVVHCSAGIGRTGTFLALDILYHQAISEGRIDVFGNVTSLRDQRVKMVQTLDQYVFLHEAVADAVLFGTHPFYSEQIDEVCMFMNQTDKESNQSGYEVQFRRIQDSVSGSKEEDLYGKIDDNAVNGEDIGCCNGGFMPLNKLELPGCSVGNVFVTSRAPTNETLPEMWTYIQEQKIRTIIMLTDQNHPQYKTHQSLGIDSGLTFGTLSLRFAEETDNTHFIERQFQIIDETENKLTLTVFEFRAWKENCSIPHSMQAMIDMLSNIVLWQPQFSEKEPIYVFCEDGASRSGLVCVLLNEVERMRFHNNMINVVESVKTMKERNKNIISNAEQLKFCYEAMQLYVQQNDQYANI